MIVVSPDGTRYAVGVHRRVDIYNIETAGIEYSIDMKVRELRPCRIADRTKLQIPGWNIQFPLRAKYLEN